MNNPQIDWAKATVKVSVPVHHTATSDVQTLDVPLEQFAAMLFEAESARVRREMAKKAVERIKALGGDAQETTR